MSSITERSFRHDTPQLCPTSHADLLPDVAWHNCSFRHCLAPAAFRHCLHTTSTVPPLAPPAAYYATQSFDSSFRHCSAAARPPS